MHKKVTSKTKPSGTDQYGHKRTRIYRREKWWQSHFQGNKTCICGKVPITPHEKQLLCSILQVSLLLPCHHGLWALFGTAVPSALGNVDTARLHQCSLLPRAKAQLCSLGFLLGGEGMNISITAQKRKNFKQLSKEKNKVSAFLCLLCLNFSLKSLALLFQVFLQLYWMSRAVDSQASLKKDTLS